MLSLAFAVLMHNQDGAAAYKAVVPSTVRIDATLADGSTKVGSGFLGLKEGVLITAWHVIAGARKVTATFSDEAQFECSGVIDRDVDRDVALVRIKVVDRPMAKLANAPAEVGSACFIVGAPKGLDASISSGVISPPRKEANKVFLQFSCPAVPGYSGGPLTNDKGEVLGVVSSHLTGSESLSFAIPVSVVKGLDSTLPTTPWSAMDGGESMKPAGGSLDESVLGAPLWSGKRDGFYEGVNSYWAVHLAYKADQPAIADNVRLGIAFLEGDVAKNTLVGLPAGDIRKLHGYLTDSLKSNSITGLPVEQRKQKFTMVGKRFVVKGLVYEPEEVQFEFEVNEKSPNKGSRWRYTIKCAGKTRWLNRDEASALKAELTKWLILLKEVGLEL